MSISNEPFYVDLLDDIEKVANLHSSSIQADSLADFLEPFETSEDLSNGFTSFSASSNIYTRSLSELSSESNDNTKSSFVVSQTADAFSSEIQLNSERLQIIEQPYQSSKLRYRSDYDRDKKRLGVLKNRNKKSIYRGPAIRIPQDYLNLNDQYYIGVCHVTVKYRKTNLHYIHPYDLENPCDEQLNDRQNNVVWFPIDQKDSITGIKSFPFLRIVKKKAVQVQKFDHLRVFDSCGQNSQNNSPRKATDIFEEYQLERSQLAFTVGKKVSVNGQSSMVLYGQTTIFSAELNDAGCKQSETDSETELSTDRTNASFSSRYIHKYAPRSGYAESNEEVLVFLKTKMEPKTFGNLQVTVECDTTEGRWSQPVLDLEVKDRMISFKTPIFPYPITKVMPVDIVLKQDDRNLGVLKYSYLSN